MSALEIIKRLPESFEHARAGGDLLFFPSSIHTHNEIGVDVSPSFIHTKFMDLDILTVVFSRLRFTHDIILQFEIRICPALQKKPSLPSPHFETGNAQLEKGARPSDPFSPPYIPALYLGELRDEEEGAQYVILVRTDISCMEVIVKELNLVPWFILCTMLYRNNMSSSTSSQWCRIIS